MARGSGNKGLSSSKCLLSAAVPNTEISLKSLKLVCSYNHQTSHDTKLKHQFSEATFCSLLYVENFKYKNNQFFENIRNTATLPIYYVFLSFLSKNNMKQWI